MRRVWVLLALTIFLTGSLGGGAYAVYRYEASAAGRILPGVRIAGVDVGGMSRAEAEDALSALAAGILDRTVTVRSADKTWTVTPRRLGTRVHVAEAIDRAFGFSGSLGWAARAFHRLFDRPMDLALDVRVSHSPGEVARFVGRVEGEVARAARDASREWIDGALAVVRSAPGRALNDPAGGARTLLQAIAGTGDSVKLGVHSVAPDLTEDDLGKLIVVRVSENRLLLYDGFDLLRTYEVATGTAEYPTPMGSFSIINKRVNPSWVNPALDTWGKDLPPVIPPGPGNPLGTRALDLDAPGIRIHGTYDDLSIGSYASHGCIRMHISESEQLFELVDVGTPVLIVS
jgi:hypothetical protein